LNEILEHFLKEESHLIAKFSPSYLAEMTSDAWASIPWEKISSKESSSALEIWHKHEVPYTPDANSLQNLEVWIPLAAGSDTPAPSAVPKRDGVWAIFIHGGAWRDARVTSSAFAPTISHLELNHASAINSFGGFASLNYSLSSHELVEAGRHAKHPDHIIDVLTGLEFLQKKFGFGSNYILLGHSCGATLAFQAAMDHQKWSSSAPPVQKPKVIVGLNGLYDLPNLIKNSGEKHKHLVPVYEDFTRMAFGDDEKVWHDISPIAVSDWTSEWTEGTKAYIVQSKADSLVPYNQLEGIQQNLQASKGPGLEVIELEAGGDHNDLWEKGDRLAEIVTEVMKSF